MKRFVLVLLMLGFCLTAVDGYAADVTFSYRIPDAKVATAMEGFLKIYPNGEMTDDDPPVAKYTDKQWVVEKIRRIIVRDIRRGLQMIANEGVSVQPDDEIVTSE